MLFAVLMLFKSISNSFFLCHCVICKGYKWVPGKQSRLLALVWFPIRDHRGSEAFSSDLFHLALTQLHLSVCPSTHHSLTPSSKMPTSPSTRVQQPVSRGAGGKKKRLWKEASPSRGPVGMETALFVNGGFSYTPGQRSPTVSWSKRNLLDLAIS